MNLDRKRWWPFVALGLIAALLAAATSALPSLAYALFAVSGCLFLVAIYFTLRDRPGKYSLEALQRVHERAEIEALEIDQPESDSLYCSCCGSAYASYFPTCPKCAKK